jgi:hypothetical protein
MDFFVWVYLIIVFFFLLLLLYYYYCCCCCCYYASSRGEQTCLCCAPLVLCWLCNSVVLCVRRLRRPQARMCACCVLRRFMASRNSLCAVGFVPPISIWGAFSLARLKPSTHIQGPPCTSVLHVLNPWAPKDVMTRQWSSVRQCQISLSCFTCFWFLTVTNMRSLVSNQTQSILMGSAQQTSKSLLDTLHKLSEDLAHLKCHNASLKSQINKLYEKC